MRVAITGSSGLIGSAVVLSLRDGGHDVLRLVRAQPRSADEVAWDPLGPSGGLAPDALAGVDAVIHLAGAPVAAGRWTAARKNDIRSSRVAGTQGLVTAVLAASPRPGVLLSGSAIGWYGDIGGRTADESAPSGTGFLAGVVRDWEAAAAAVAPAGVRVVTLRTGIVLSGAGGLVGRLRLPFSFGLGARIGTGNQVMSWIALTDVARAVAFLLDRGDIAGPVNLTAPAPVTNAEFTAALASALRRPALMRLPAAGIRLALGELSGELLASARVLPARLTEAGFQFRHPEVAGALAAALRPA